MAYASQPSDDAIAKGDPLDPRSRTMPKLVIGDRWRRWLSGLTVAVDTRPERKAVVKLTAQGAAIATTALPIGSVGPGLWGIYTHLRVSRAGSVSLTVQLTISWTDEDGNAQSEAGTSLSGNLLTTRDGRLFLLRPQNATVISYAVSYADGGGAVNGLFALDLVAVQLGADL